MLEGAELRLRTLKRRLEEFYRSIWFFPILMSMGTIVLFLATSELDRTVDFGRIRGGFFDPLIFTGSAEAARSILTAIAGSWATILGVVFSITLVTIQLSATKYSAQILPQFTKDKLNQLVLGSWLATVIYAFLVLKTVRTGQNEFAPVIGVNLALLFAVVSLGLVVAFITNIIEFIRPRRFIVQTSDDATQALRKLLAPIEQAWLTAISDHHREAQGVKDHDLPQLNRKQIHARASGFVSSVNWDDLAQIARHLLEQDRQGARRYLSIGKQVGDPVARGEAIGELWVPPRDKQAEHLTDWVSRAFVISKSRQPDTDPAYGLTTLAELALKAISSSADIDAAVECTNGLFDVLGECLRTPEPAPLLLIQVDDEELLVERPVRNLTRLALEGIENINRASVRQHYSSVVQLSCGRYSRLLSEMLEERRGSQVRTLLHSMRPVFVVALRELEDEYSVQDVTGVLIEAVERSIAVNDDLAASEVLDLVEYLRTVTANRSIVVRELRNRLGEIRAKSPCTDLPKACARIKRVIEMIDRAEGGEAA